MKRQRGEHCSPPPPGWKEKTLTPQYQFLECINSGAYGEVYKALDTTCNQPVALKHMKVRLSGDDEKQTRSRQFQIDRELKILEHLSHRHILGLRETLRDSEGQSLYMVMDFMQHDLCGISQPSNYGKTFSRTQCKMYTKQLLEALAYLHSRNVMHRDVKPENILIDLRGDLRLADFGLACVRVPERENRYTNPVVTLWYRAPEVLLKSRNYNCGVDNWSAGCVMAELLMNSTLFPGTSDADQMWLIRELCGSCEMHAALPGWQEMVLHNRPPSDTKRNVHSVWPEELHLLKKHPERGHFFTDSTLDVLRSLLNPDAKRRGSAETVLKMPYFTEERPLPLQGLGTLPRYPGNHFGRSKRKKQ